MFYLTQSNPLLALKLSVNSSTYLRKILLPLEGRTVLGKHIFPIICPTPFKSLSIKALG